MRRAACLAVALAATLGLGGCANTFDASALGVPVTMASAAGEQPTGRHFEVTTRAVYGLWGLVPLRQPSLRKALASELVGGSGVSNVRIRVRSRWSDVLITGLTLGLIAPRAVTYEGVVTGGPAATATP